tara:strand:+ start:1039 stop:1545 length:507 start_codon:yes stop_codon:yes gene_type:complete
MKNAELKNPVIFNDDGTCYIIILENSKVAHKVILDTYQLIHICGRRWFYSTGYAVASNNNDGWVEMGKTILNTSRTVDHINRNRLDNRTSNLRPCTVSQNNANRKGSNKTSRYKGVSKCKSTGKWVVRISNGGKYLSGGRFLEEKEAAKKYNEMAIKIFGEFAYLNEV